MTSSTPSNYVLGSGDQITVTVFGYDEYTGAQTILPDGTIALPLVGSISATGQTIDSLTRNITARLDLLLVDPVVTISLTTLRPVVVNVAGEVQRPGPIQLRSTINSATATTGGSTIGNTSGSVPTVSSALVEAGGITRNADIRQVVVRRAAPGGGYRTITVNLWDAIWSDAAPQDVALQADDTVFVPRLAADAAIDRRLMARSSFSPRTVRVRVVGEVNSPGQIEVAPDSSLSSAIASAGGPTEDARLREVGLIRLDENGSVSTQEVDLSELNDTYQVQEGDVVVVPERSSSSFLRGLGRVLAPLGGILSIFDGLF
jgi:polysaccharide export outer membrane protein